MSYDSYNLDASHNSQHNCTVIHPPKLTRRDQNHNNVMDGVSATCHIRTGLLLFIYYSNIHVQQKRNVHNMYKMSEHHMLAVVSLISSIVIVCETKDRRVALVAYISAKHTLGTEHIIVILCFLPYTQGVRQPKEEKGYRPNTQI